MIISLFSLLALVAIGDAYVLARRVEQRIEDRATYQGGYALSNPVSCPANYSTACGPKTDVNQLCCPQGDTCFGSYVGYCCPTSQDCNTYVTTFSACADPDANMYISPLGHFCCAQGLTAVIPSSGFPFCETADVSVAVSLLATMVSQYGGTSVTPFGGFATTPAATGNAVNTGAGVVTPTAISHPTPTGSSTSPTNSSSSNSTFGPLSNTAFIGLVIGGFIVLCIALSIWRWCKRKVRSSIENMDQSYSAGPSMIPAYIPTNIQIYEPAPRRPYDDDIYDPVLERHSAVSPMSPSRTPIPMTPGRTPVPMTPSPAYSAVEQHEMPDRTNIYDPIEVHGIGSMRGRIEMP